MIHLPTPPTATCPYCGGFPILTSYGSACSGCGSVLEDVRYVHDIVETMVVKSDHIYTSDIVKGTHIGRPNECDAKWKKLRHYDYVHNTVQVFQDELFHYKRVLELTFHEFYQWKYKIEHTTIPRFLKYYYWAGLLYQVISSKHSLDAICALFTAQGHHVSKPKVKLYFGCDNLKLPPVDYCKRFVATLRRQYPTLDLTHINSYIIPAIPRMTSKFRAAISLGRFLEARHQWSFLKTATTIGISASQLYAEKHRWEMWKKK